MFCACACLLYLPCGSSIWSHWTGIALWRHCRHNQWDPDCVDYQRASSRRLAAGTQNSCTGFWRWCKNFDSLFNLSATLAILIILHSKITPIIMLWGIIAVLFFGCVNLLSVITEGNNQFSFLQAAALRGLFVLFNWFHLGPTHLA